MSHPAPRRELERSVELTLENSDAGVDAVTQNISASGMLVLAPTGGPPGRFLRFDFEEFSGTGEIIWTRAHEDGRTFMGVRFVTMSAGGRRALLRMVSEG